MGRAEVLDDHEGHAGVGWQRRKELFKGSQPTSGSANAHNGEVISRFTWGFGAVGN